VCFLHRALSSVTACRRLFRACLWPNACWVLDIQAVSALLLALLPVQSGPLQHCLWLGYKQMVTQHMCVVHSMCCRTVQQLLLLHSGGLPCHQALPFTHLLLHFLHYYIPCRKFALLHVLQFLIHLDTLTLLHYANAHHLLFTDTAHLHRSVLTPSSARVNGVSCIRQLDLKWPCMIFCTCMSLESSGQPDRLQTAQLRCAWVECGAL
jgi:hypothetical protein